MVAEILADEQRKFILKQYVETEVTGRDGLEAFNSFPPIYLINYYIREKFHAIKGNYGNFSM